MTLNKIRNQISDFSNNQNKIMEKAIRAKLKDYLVEYNNALKRAEQAILNKGIKKVFKQL